MKDIIKAHKFMLILVALLFLLITPLIISLTYNIGIPPGLTIVLIYSFVILTTFNAAERRIPRLLCLFFGSVTLLSVWIEFLFPFNYAAELARMISTLSLFIILCFILVRSFIDQNEINLKTLVAASCGFILLGIIGGIFYELIEFLEPGSIDTGGNSERYTYYYFSFISLTTVGYGDILPKTPQAQSVTILLSIIGQFYMAVGVAMSVGKYLSHQQASKEAKL